ncbi:MAG: nitroreductase family protein [Bdellovibrionales bacterium]|nr:nitroreductase family protein [Bdellovibrionales bacterium]
MADEFSKIFDRSKNTYREPAAEVNFEEFIKDVESRRSVRGFDGQSLPEDVMRKCLELALLAPSSSNLQPWEFYWVRNKEKRSELNKAFLSQPAVTTAGDIVVCVARTKTWHKNAKKMLQVLSEQEAKGQSAHKAVFVYYKKLVPFVYGLGPFGLFGCIKKLIFFFRGLSTPTPREPTSYSDMKIWAVKSAALACENLMLAFRAAGYDSCPMEGMDSSRVKKILNLPCDAIVVMGISAGRRVHGGVYGPRVRFDSAQFIKEI